MFSVKPNFVPSEEKKKNKTMGGSTKTPAEEGHLMLGSSNTRLHDFHVCSHPSKSWLIKADPRLGPVARLDHL